MKYLLSILILFSGFSFSVEGLARLICDKPYTFYPDLEKRKIYSIAMDGDQKRNGTVIERSFSGNIVFYQRSIEEQKIKWKKLPSTTSWFGTLDRTTLEISYENGDSIQCKIVESEEWLKGVDELEELREKALDKRKI